MTAVLCMLWACGSSGISPTETGNPPINPDQAIPTTHTPPLYGLYAYSRELSQALCAKLVEDCHAGGTVSDCLTGLSDAQNVISATDVASTVYPTFNDISAGEQSRALFADVFKLRNCVYAIHSLSCDEPSVVQAAEGMVSQDFSKVGGMLAANSGMCTRLFWSKAISSGEMTHTPVAEDDLQ